MDHRRENHHHHPRQQLHQHHQPRQQQQHHHHHHQTRYHHPPPPHIINSPPPSPPPPPPSSSRYFPLHPHPPPPPLPPPSFPESNPSFFPPQQHHHHPSFQPHQKPLNDFTFANSPPRHHYRDDPRDAIFRSPSRVHPPSDRPLLYDSHDHNRTHPDDVVMDRPRFHLNELPPPPPPPARVPPLSPTRFVPFDGFSRQFDRDDFNVDPRVRSQQHPDEFPMRRDRVDDDRRIIDRLEDDFDPNWNRNRGFERHERYYPEMVMRKEFELNSGNSEYEPIPLNDEDMNRGGRRDNNNVGFEGNVNKRFAGGREVSRSPIKFRIGGGEGDDRFVNRGRKEDVQEYNNRGTSRKNLQKKSAFLRIQEVKPQHYTSNFRNRFDNNTTPSPHKGKESNSERVDNNRVSEERVGSPVELDVSFKSNALVAKAIMAAPSCSGVETNVNNGLSDSGTRIDSESLSKVASPKLKSVVSVREDKDSKTRVRVSPIMKRVGNRNNVEVHSSESSPGGSSSLSGGVVRKAASKGKVLVKGHKNAGFEKVSTPINRKKRKVSSQVSQLSRPMPSKTDSELVNVSSSASHLSDGSMPSDLSVKQSAKAMICGGNVTGSSQNECVDTGNFDINDSPTVVDQEEIVGQSVSEQSDLKRMRKTEILESYPDSSRSLGSGVSESHGNAKGFLQDEKKVSNPDKNVTKVVEKCSLENHSEEISVKGQDTAVVCVDNCSVEGSPELASVCMGENVDNNDISPLSVDTVNSVAVMSFIPNTDHVTTNIKDEVDLMCPIVDGAEPCETQIFPSPENTTIGLSLGGLYSDSKYEPELRHSENNAKLVSFSNVADKPCETKPFSSPDNVTIGLSLGGLYSDNYEKELGHSKDIASIESFSNVSDKRTSHSSNDDFNIVLKNTDTASDVRVTDDIQEQQYQGLGTILGIHDTTLERDNALTTCALPLSVDTDFSLINRKRKVGFEPDSLDSKVYESGDESVMSLKFPVENAMFPVEMCSSTVSGSPSVEPVVSKGNGCTESFSKGMDAFNGIDYLDRIEYSSISAKKRKVLLLESVFCDTPGSESSDLPVSALTLLPAADGASAQLAGGFEPKSTIAGECGAGGATESLYVEACSFTDTSKSDFLCKDSCLSITGSVLPDAEQSNMPETRCNEKKIGNLMTAEVSDDNALVALESTHRMATSDGNCGLPCLSADDTGDVHQGAHTMSTESDDNRMVMTDGNSGLPCLSTDCTGDLDQGPLIMNMECDDNVGDVNEGSLAVNMEYAGNIALNANPSSLSGCVQSCAESMHGVTTNSDLLDTPSNAGLPADRSVFSSTLDISNDSPAIHVISGEKRSMEDINSNQSAATQISFLSEVNLLPETHNYNTKTVISASSAVQPFARKSVLLPSKNVNTTVSSSNSMSRLRKNVLTRSEAIPSTSQHSPVVNPSNKPRTFPAKPRTWRRTNNLTAANVPVKKPAVGPPPRPLYGNAMKVQDASYIRKGNSLVRNPASGASTSGSHAFGASIDRSKPNDSYRTRNIVVTAMPGPIELPDGLVNGGRSTPIEMPKTPPLSCSGTGQDSDVVYSGGCTSSLPVDQSGGADNGEAMKPSDSPLNFSKDIENVANRTLEDPGVFSDGDLLGSNSKRMIYVKRKSNQLIAASNSSQLSVHNMGKTAASSSDKNYFKRRKNQLIRASSDGNIQQMVAVVKNNFKSLSQRAPHTYYGRSSTKRLSNKAKSSKFSLVWKLGDSKSSVRGVDALRSRKLLSHLLPWKRDTCWSRKLLSSKKRGAVYVRSGRGFSLRRSKVTSLPGTSLKWSKSMEKRSKKIEEEAVLAVSALDSVQQSGSSGLASNATNGSNSLHKHKVVPGLKLHPGERIFRIGVFRYRMDPSRRTLQRISDEEASDFTASETEKDARKTYVPKRLLIGTDEYVRIGNGNQLVRDPKRRTRILANEKVRWSLHTARMRLAKKRKFCQFFTRFGKCNKGEGKCPFIHDPSKIAVCTKFLNGLCVDSNCKLTHKVIPERMPDCSFYLQGLCSNEICPYRHVNVNPKASICENFLRGYCAEGNECRMKHSYICPEFEVSGSCPQGSKCKLYHPKKAKAKKRKKVSREENNAKGRYFGSDIPVVAADPESSPVIEKTVESGFAIQGELGDFISLDISDNEELENDPMNSQLDDLDEMIKPLSILGTT